MEIYQGLRYNFYAGGVKIYMEGMENNEKISVPCCGHYTYNVPANEDCGFICPVCFWENDPFIASDSEPSDSNHGMTLKKAKSNYLEFGACEKEMLCHVRPPRDDEKEQLW